MKRVAVVVALVVMAGLAHSQSAPRLRPVIATPIEASPSAESAASLPKDYEALYRKEAERNRSLKGELATLTSRIAELTRPGGSLVQAYCESDALSRNTAGAQNDCSAGGYACEPVSGLCRTTASSSLHCAAGFTYCSVRLNCVRSAEECR